MTIQVSNLPSDITDAQLADLKARFSKFGKVQKFEVMNQIITVQLDSGEDAAIQALDGIEWPEPPRPPRPPKGGAGDDADGGDPEVGDGPHIKVKKAPPK